MDFAGLDAAERYADDGNGIAAMLQAPPPPPTGAPDVDLGQAAVTILSSTPASRDYDMLYVRVFVDEEHRTYITMAADGPWATASIADWRARAFDQISRAWGAPAGAEEEKQAEEPQGQDESSPVAAMLRQGEDAFVFRFCGPEGPDSAAPGRQALREWDRWLTDPEQPLCDAHDELGTAEPMFQLELRPERAVPPPPITATIRGTEQGLDLSNREHTLYVIDVLHGPLQWKIRKRYSEFHALHEQLSAGAATGATLPRLPGKRALGALNPNFVAQRRAALHEYIGRLLEMPELAHSVELLSFLGVLSTARHEALSTHRKGEGRNVIHISRLKFHVKFGDIVLFRCASTLSGLQRRVTGAEWDHVAMVVRSGLLQSYDLLEATGDGVTSYPLVSRIRAYSHQFTRYMVLRRLDCKRTRAMSDALSAFVDQVNGVPYGFAMTHLFPKKRGQGEAKEENQSSFFCSQLVARALKEMGVLPADRNSAFFWPGSFAEGGELDKAMVEGASFGPEIVIDCQVLEVSHAQRDPHRESFLGRRSGSAGSAAEVAATE